MQRERIVAAACGSQRIVVASFRREPGGILWPERVESRAVPEGTGWLEELVRVLGDERWQLRGRTRVVVAPPDEWVWLKTIRVPRVSAHARAALVRFELAHGTPFAPGTIVGESLFVARGEADDEHLLCVLKLEAAQRIAGALRTVHRAVRVVPLAARLPQLATVPTAAGTRALVWLGEATTLVALGHPNGVTIRSFGPAERDAPGNEGGFPDAEDPATLARGILTWRQELGIAGVRDVHLAGNERRIGIVQDALALHLNRPVERFHAPELTGVAGAPGVELAGVLALARGEMAGVDSIDLTPEEARRARALRPRRRAWLLSAALLVLGGALVLARLSSVAGAGERRLGRLERELSPLRALAPERVTQVQKLWANDDQWRELLRLERGRGLWLAIFRALDAAFETAENARIERVGWSSGVADDPRRPVGVGPVEPPLRIRLRGVVEVTGDARAAALEEARRLLGLLARTAPFIAVEHEQFDDRHQGGVEFESDLVLGVEATP